MNVWLSLQPLPVEVLGEVAVAAERCGAEGVTVSDHVCVPRSIASVYPYTGRTAVLPVETEFPDPMTLVASLAARTTSLRFMTHVLLVALRHPIVLAKEIATVERLSGGRFDLGVGVGWLEEEFAAVGVDYHRRGAITDEAIAVMRQLWSGEPLSHQGAAYRFAPLSAHPCPPAPVEVYAGGYSPAALRRAARLDGWLGVTPSFEELARLLADLAELRRGVARSNRPFVIRSGVKGSLDRDRLSAVAALGVDALIVTPHQLGLTAETPGDQVVDRVTARLPELVEICSAALGRTAPA